VGLLDELIEAHIDISGYVLQIGARTWAIHATIPVEGSVLVAEYGSAEEANGTLGQLAPNHGAEARGSLSRSSLSWATQIGLHRGDEGLHGKAEGRNREHRAERDPCERLDVGDPQRRSTAGGRWRRGGSDRR